MEMRMELRMVYRSSGNRGPTEQKMSNAIVPKMLMKRSLGAYARMTPKTNAPRPKKHPYTAEDLRKQSISVRLKVKPVLVTGYQEKRLQIWRLTLLLVDSVNVQH
jgi:hypothetical protein